MMSMTQTSMTEGVLQGIYKIESHEFCVAARSVQ
jgi:hypothetical protein